MKRHLVKLIFAGLCSLSMMVSSTSAKAGCFFPHYRPVSYGVSYRPFYSTSYYRPAYYGYSAWRPYGSYRYYGSRVRSYYRPSYSPCGSACSPCEIASCSTGTCGVSCAALPLSNTPLKPTPDNSMPPKPKTFDEEANGKEDGAWKGTETDKSSDAAPPADTDANEAPFTGDGSETSETSSGNTGLSPRRETLKVPTQIVPQRNPKSPDTKVLDEDEGQSGDSQKPSDNDGAKRKDNAAQKDTTAKQFPALNHLDNKITWRSVPKRTRLQVRSNPGRVKLVRRGVLSNRNWMTGTGTRIVKK